MENRVVLLDGMQEMGAKLVMCSVWWMVMGDGKIPNLRKALRQASREKDAVVGPVAAYLGTYM